MKKIIVTNKQLSQFDFKNIVTIALRLNRYEWVDKFITNWVAFLPEEERINAEIYNRSRLHYSTGNYRKALKMMQNVEFTDVYYRLDAKVLLLKIYYDTNAFEPFGALSRSFTNFLNRNSKVSSYQQETYLNFIKLSSRMFNYKMFDKGNPQKILEDVTNASNVADINWLRQKTSDLI